jgi:hypothetical protein
MKQAWIRIGAAWLALAVSGILRAQDPAAAVK